MSLHSMLSTPLGRVTAALAATACLAACDSQDGPTAPSEPAVPFYTVIGASDAIGQGGSVVCAPYDLGCEQGTGYAQRVIRRLRAEQGETGYQNLGFPGWVLSPAVATLAGEVRGDTPGNFIEREAPFVKPETTMVSIFAGGNDANIIGEAVKQGRGGADPLAYVNGEVSRWGDDYRRLIDGIRERAPQARIVAFNMPNMGAAPYVAARPAAERAVLQHITVGMADQVNALAGSGVLVVDLLCDSRIYNPANFGSDGFHPSDQGYALMADLLYPALAHGTAAAPAAACPERTLVPGS